MKEFLAMGLMPTLPTPVGYFVEGFYRAHRLLALYGQESPDTISAAYLNDTISGWTLQCCAGNNETVKLAAHVLTIATECLAVIAAQRELVRSFHELRKSFSQEHQPLFTFSLHPWRFLSPREKLLLGRYLNQFIVMFYQSRLLLYNLLLSSCLMLKLTKSLQSPAQSSEVQEVATNIRDCRRLLHELEDAAEELTALLHWLGVKDNFRIIHKLSACGQASCTVANMFTYAFSHLYQTIQHGLFGPLKTPYSDLSFSAKLLL